MKKYTSLQKTVIFLLIVFLLSVVIFMIFFDNTNEFTPIYAGIAGAVKNPGVYDVSSIKQLYELIILAGGLKENADMAKIDAEKFIKPFSVYCIPYKKIEKINKIKYKKIIKNPDIPNSITYKEINIIYAGLPRTYLLITLIPDRNLIIVTHIPYYTLIPNSFYTKTLLETYLSGGVAFLINSAQRILGKKVDYYFTQNREQWIKFIDTLGGIKVKIPPDFKKEYQLKNDVMVLDGYLSWEYIRFIDKFYRKTDLTVGTFYRMKNQKAFVKSMFNKLKENNFFRQSKTLKILLKNSDTNLKAKDLVKIFFEFKNIKKTKLELCTLPGALKEFNGKDVWVVQTDLYNEELNKIVRNAILR